MHERLALDANELLALDTSVGIAVLVVIGVVTAVFAIGALCGWWCYREVVGGHEERVRDFVQRQYRDHHVAQSQLWDRR